MQMKFPTTFNILNSPFIWIGDTRATGHSTFTSQGGINSCKSKIMTHGVVGVGIKPNKEMYLECTYCDEFGNKLYNITLADISHLPDSDFNLLSLTRMIRGGWTMVKNQYTIIMTKGDKMMRFSIKVPTKQELLFYTCLRRKGKVLSNVTDQVKLTLIKKFMLCPGTTTRQCQGRLKMHLPG